MSETGTRAICIAGACLVGSGRFLLHVPTHCTGSNVYVHASARGARDVARSMSGVAGLVSRARRSHHLLLLRTQPPHDSAFVIQTCKFGGGVSNKRCSHQDGHILAFFRCVQAVRGVEAGVEDRGPGTEKRGPRRRRGGGAARRRKTFWMGPRTSPSPVDAKHAQRTAHPAQPRGSESHGAAPPSSMRLPHVPLLPIATD